MGELQDHENALRELWRELAAKGIRDGVDYPRIVLTLFDDLDRLTRWKHEAMTLFDGLQDLGRALEVPLGALVTGTLAVEAANSLVAERDALRDRLAAVETGDRP